MDVAVRYKMTVMLLLFAGGVTRCEGRAPRIQFDLPAVAAAVPADGSAGAGVVSIDLTLSSLIVDSADGNIASDPPIDHLLVRCRLRDRLPVIDYTPKTELNSEFSGLISVTQTQERSDSFGLSIDGAYHPIGGAHLGSDDSKKQSDSTQFQKTAPLKAVVASGTIDRGRGVYFKFRWTAGQVLEGEKPIRLSFAVPQSWRGGLLDVEVTAAGVERSVFGPSKIRPLVRRPFVVAVHRVDDPAAAAIAMRLADLDRQLASLAAGGNDGEGNAMTQWWRRITMQDPAGSKVAPWYERVMTAEANPHTDESIRSLPMPVRVAVLRYTRAAEQLNELGDAG